jgi:hypothetical protein
MNQYFKEENEEVFLWDTYDYFHLSQVALPGFAAKLGTVKEIIPKIGDYVWAPQHNYFGQECWALVDEAFLEIHASLGFFDNYRYVFLLKN